MFWNPIARDNQSLAILLEQATNSDRFKQYNDFMISVTTGYRFYKTVASFGKILTEQLIKRL